MDALDKVVEELVNNGVLDYNDAMEKVEDLRRHIEDSQKVGDTSRLFLMNLFKEGKLQMTDIQYYAEKLNLLETKPEQREIAPSTEHIQNFKVYESGKNDRIRYILQFDFGRCTVGLMSRGKTPRMLQFDEITNFDVVNNSIIIMTEKETLQLVNDSESESEKIHQLLRSIGHDDGIEQVLDDTLIQGQLDKKGPGLKGIRSLKRWVAVTHGKLSYYKMDGPDNNVRTECPQNSLELKEGKNYIKKFGSDGFTIVSIEDDKEFSFTIPGKKLKSHQIITERDKWVHFIEQAYIGNAGINNYTQQDVQTIIPLTRTESRRATVTKRSDSGTKDGQILINMVRQELEKISQKMDYAVGEDEAAPQVRRINEILSSIEVKLSSGAVYVPQASPESYKPPPKAEMITSCCQTDIPYTAPEHPSRGPQYPSEGPEHPSGGPQYPPGGPQYPPGGPQYPPGGPQYPSGGPEYPSGTAPQPMTQPPPINDRSRTSSIKGSNNEVSQHTMSVCPLSTNNPSCPLDNSVSSMSSLLSESVEYEAVESTVILTKEPLKQCVEDEPVYDTPPTYRPARLQDSERKPAPPPRKESRLSLRGRPRGEPPLPPQRKDSKLSININDVSIPQPIIEELPPPPPEDDVLYDQLPINLPSPLPPSPKPQREPENNMNTTPTKVKPPIVPRQISVPSTPPKEEDHTYNSIETELKPKVLTTPTKAPSAPISPPVPGAPATPQAPGPPRPPSGSLIKGSLEPHVLPKVKVFPLHWHKIPPLALKNSVWREMGDKSRDIDVHRLELLFATKPVNTDKPKKKQNEQRTLLDAKRAQNLGIFLRGAAMDSHNLESFVSSVPSRTSSVSMDKVVTLKKYLPTKEDREAYGRLKSETINKLDKVDQFMYHMINVPHLAERLDILDVCCNLPQDYDDLKIMVDYVCDACKGLLESTNFKTSLEIVLTVGNMMNASIKKTAAGFKLSTTLSKLPTIKSADRTSSLLDFLVDQMIDNDGECLKFIEELDVCHRATELTSGSIVSLTAEVDIMKQELRKLQQYKKQLSGVSDKSKSKDLVKFINEVDTFISMYQPSVEALNTQCLSMRNSYQKVLERFGESPKTDSEDFFKTISEYLRSVEGVLKKSKKQLPPCVAHLAPPSPASTGSSTPTMGSFKQKQVNIGDALAKSNLFKKSATVGQITLKQWDK